MTTSDISRPESVTRTAPAGGERVVEGVRTATRVAVILPVYNESRVIGRTLDAVLAAARADEGVEFVFVDDGSTDGTAERIEAAISVAGLANIVVRRSIRNRGKASVVRDAALAIAREGRVPLICFTDGDLAYSLDHVPQLETALRVADVVIGSRSLVHRDERNVKLARRVLGWGFNKLARLALWLPYRDTQAGLKGFRRQAAERVFARQRLTDFSFDVELVFLTRRMGLKIAQIPARVSEDHAAKATKVDLIRDPLRMLRGVAIIRLNAWLGRYR
ncbi:MAG: glycosyltransferase [Planctomycetota bacterium]|nr:glycosyltransferase [Planctomycetota bacterium]